MVTATSSSRDQADTALPEVNPIDGSGQDKYYVSPDEAQNIPSLGHTRDHVPSEGPGYIEHGSTLPERTYKDEDKQAVEITYPVGYLDQRSVKQNEEDTLKKPEAQSSHFKIKKWHFLLGVVGLVALIVAVVVGVVIGTRSHTSSTSTPSPPQSTVDAESSVGGYLNPDYYSKKGAWNGSGVGLAGADLSSTDQLLLVFYQDFTGDLTYRSLNYTGSTQMGSVVDKDRHKPLNGTPISVVEHQLENILRWHLFYIDEDHYMRERIMTNESTAWTDGPLTEQNLKTFVADRVGMTACYHGDYYGVWSYNGTQAAAGINLWFATSGTTISQYEWTNGTDSWSFQNNFSGLDGHAPFGCQTWDTGLTEYLFYIDNNQEIGLYWLDNNRSETATPEHPVGSWTKGNSLDVQSVYKASALGYTNYLVYQSIDGTIRGVNITFGAENTTVAENPTSGGRATWILTTGDDYVTALDGTNLAITAFRNANSGGTFAAFFQEQGDDISYYTRDVFNESALWQKMTNIV